MKNYTTIEIQEMQKEAIERVREMQRRSQLTRQQANIDLGETQPAQQRQEPARQSMAPHQNEAQRQPSVQRQTPAQQGSGTQQQRQVAPQQRQAAPQQRQPQQQKQPAPQQRQPVQPVLSQRQPAQPQKQAESDIRAKIPDTPRRISLPVEFPENMKLSSRSTAPAEAEAAAAGITLRNDSAPNDNIENAENAENAESKGFLDEIDSEKALILALVLLLSGEGADLELILALLYIMY
ncbi:MAG: hypothetical protein LBS36_12525 [Oscillospiraceae bacterium]|jgi:hypothetical protein|nr:hypothetical protein [Oscillospiraceae bacterium]